MQSGKWPALFLIIFASACSETKDEVQRPAVPKVTSIEQCDRTYNETRRTIDQVTLESTFLKYDSDSGKVKLIRGEPNYSQKDVTFSMERERFFKICSPDGSKLAADACPYYIECISQVIHNSQGRKGKARYLDFEATAFYLREEAKKLGELNPSVTEPHRYSTEERPLTTIKNVHEACESVSGTHSPGVVAAAIFENIPEVPDFKTARTLGEKAVKGYGECSCVLSDHLGLELKMSIGHCRWDQFVSY